MFQGLTTEPMPLFEREKAEVFDGVLELKVAERLDEDYHILCFLFLDILLSFLLYSTHPRASSYHYDISYRSPTCLA